MTHVRRWLSVHYLHRRRALATALALMLIAELCASIGIAYVAGFPEIRATFSLFSWPWLLALAGALVVSYAGYYYAYRGVYVVEGGKSLSARHMHAVVTGAFGGFFAHGGGTVDEYAVEATGATKRDAQVRAAALTGFEQGVLALAACAAAIIALATGSSGVPSDVTIPWAVAPIPGFALAFWLAEHYRDRLRERQGWRRRMGVFLDSIHLVRELFRTPHRHASAPLAMAVFWAGDAFALWASLAAFGEHMNALALIVAYATGMVFTRRTAPLAGAGVLMLILPITLWHCGAPLATAVVGAFVYRVLTQWGPFPFSLFSLPALREMREAAEPAEVATAAEPAEVATAAEPVEVATREEEC
jgi:uncharacterized membrane protein YbhN (UPF0104 family)